MKVLGLDIYKDAGCRINKDTNGGYGAVNDFGMSRRGKLLAKVLKKGVDSPPLYLMSTLSVLSSQGHDCNYSRTIDQHANSYDLVVLSSSIVCCESELEAIRKMTARGIRTFAIGPFASQMPDPYLDAGASVFIGEPDTYFLNHPEMIDQVINETTPKIYKPEFVPPVNFDDLPLIRWDLYLKDHKSSIVFLGHGKALPVFSSRGCPYSCFNYCTYPLQQGRKHRKFSPRVLVDRLEHYKNTYGVSKFLFRDPVFTLDKVHVTEICNEIISRKLKLWWGAELHLKDVDSDLAKLMHKAGLRCVYVGIETINPDSITVSKRFSAKKTQQDSAIQWLEESGISVKGMFILGMPEDNVANIDKTLDVVKTLPVTYLQFSVFTPYPGTPIYDQYKHLVKATKYEDYTQWDLIFDHANLTPQDANLALDKFYKQSYLTPKRFFKMTTRLSAI